MEDQHAQVCQIKSEKIEQMKAHYIQDAKNRLPQYFSPEKRMSTSQGSIEKLQQNGLPKEIFWKMVEYNVSAKEGLSLSNLDEISEYIDFLASEYVVYYERVKRDYVGEERTQQIEELETIFRRCFERMTAVYTRSVGKFFERNDIPDESQVMQKSIAELFLRKVHQYNEFIQMEPDYAEIQGTNEEWLLRDSYFMGDVLRLMVSKLYTQCTIMPTDLYSEADLRVAATIYQSAQKWLIPQKSTAVSEEQLGIELGLFAIKFQVALTKEDLSLHFKEKLATIFDSFYAYKIEDLNQRHKEAQEHLYNREHARYAPLDEEVVRYWTRTMCETLDHKGISAIFEEVIPYAFEEFKKKVQQGSKLERYQKNNEWDHFYAGSEQVNYRQSAAFTYKLRLNDWHYFLDKMNMDFNWYYLK